MITPKLFRDNRGFFLESYRSDYLEGLGAEHSFVQENTSLSSKGVVRGVHFQKTPHAQAKLVSVAVGAIFDVAVDLRHGSPTFGQWVGATLTSDERSMLFVPEGFGHGFQALSDEALVIYRTNRPYAPDSDRGFRWDDPSVGIPWPIKDAVLSPKDMTLPPFGEADINFTY